MVRATGGACRVRVGVDSTVVINHCDIIATGATVPVSAETLGATPFTGSITVTNSNLITGTGKSLGGTFGTGATVSSEATARAVRNAIKRIQDCVGQKRKEGK